MTKDDWCGIGYHCDDDDLAEDCMLKSMVAATGLNDLTSYINEPLSDKVGDLINSPAGKATIGGVIGKKATSWLLKKTGGALALYGLYEAGKTFYKTMGQCMDLQRSGYDWSWSKSGN